ncbi:MAG TPA: hypothetical protein VK996_18860 [Ramlibacter sp.]|nr:hypothetical protein [Ramlibacter sp.]
MKHMTFGRAPVSVAVSALLLAACGGGGGSEPVAVTDPPVVGTDIPVSATTSSAGALAFVKLVASASSNTADPLVAGDAVLATSETDEPDPGV